MKAPKAPISLDPWGDAPTTPTRFSGPRDIWAASKQIDGLGGEWSYSLFAHRAINFHSNGVAPHWSDPLRSFNRVREEMWFRLWALDAEVPLDQVTGVSVSLQVFRSVFSATGNAFPLPEPDEPTIGRHAVTIVGLEGEDAYFFSTAGPTGHLISPWARSVASTFSSTRQKLGRAGAVIVDRGWRQSAP